MSSLLGSWQPPVLFRTETVFFRAEFVSSAHTGAIRRVVALLTLTFAVGTGAAAISSAFAAEGPSASPAATSGAAKHLLAVQSELQAAQKRHSARLDALAQGFSDLGLTADAQHCRELASPMATTLFRIQKPPKEVQAEIPQTLPEKERELRLSLRKLQDEYAAELYTLSRKALRAGYPSYAFQIVQEIVRHNPDHVAARRILGYERRTNEWITPYAAEMLRRGMVWDDTFGWLRKDQVARYKAGRRFCNGRWMSADKEAEIRRDFHNAWKIDTDHFRVFTNHSQERGVEIAKDLEQYHDFFMQTFAAFFSTPDQMRALFQSASSGTAATNLNKKYKVDYFRTRDEYMRRLVSRVPQIGITNGLYYTSDRVSYFYYDPDQPNPDTLFHEATHQFFYESLKGTPMIAVDANFWIVEGIACYMESYHAENGQFVVGDPKHVRIEAARRRCLVDNYYVPLERFAAMGMQEFQSSRDISKNYSQAAGLAHFFMHYDGGRYRDASIEHLSEIYRAGPRQRLAVRSLAELTGTSYPELDQQYLEYMRTLPEGTTQASAIGR